jgi:RNA polymerase sigma-70 factor (ECF subfamily)
MEPDGKASGPDARDLFREHGAAVYRFALVLVRHHHDAEDVVQETFMKLLRHLGSGGDTGNLRGWLFTVAAHAARDRQRRRMRWLPWTRGAEPAVDPSPLPDEDGRYKALREALRSLSERDRLLLALRAQGLSYREIAAAAEIGETSVSQLLARATERWSRKTSELRNGEGYEPSYERANPGRR